MCSIIISTKEIPEYVKKSHLLQNRGPDLIQYKERDGIHFGHYLLNVTGDFTPQPLESEHVLALFNGEIYNFKNVGYDNEIEMVVRAYLAEREGFYQCFDGEYAICVADFESQKLYLLTDPFATKPLYFAMEDGEFGVCSYKEPLQQIGFKSIRRCPPNSMVVLDWQRASIKQQNNLFKFQLSQHKTDYDDWCNAFVEAIRKRFVNQQYDIILPLSGGHDSGAIACALNHLNATFHTYTFWGYEDREVLTARLALQKQKDSERVHEYIRRSSNGDMLRRLVEEDRAQARSLMARNCPSFGYGPDLDETNRVKNGEDDIGAQGLCYLLDNVKRQNPRIRILASGQGGDEIMGNLPFYGFPDPNPIPFPNDLNSVFPWRNFYMGAQSSYLSRDESVSGGFGIEGRYPLLDKAVVQAFLSLSAKLKNAEYKAPIAHFLRQFSYPFAEGEGVDIKRGFNV